MEIQGSSIFQSLKICSRGQLNANIAPSMFWKEVQALSHFSQLGMTFSPRHLGAVQFWTDTWCHSCPLQITFPQLFDICLTKTVTVQEVVHTQGSCLQFRKKSKCGTIRRMATNCGDVAEHHFCLGHRSASLAMRISWAIHCQIYVFVS